MEGSINDLSKYRFDTAKDNLDTAKLMLKDKKYKASVNRSYYAIFHALRSVTVLDGFDSSKHSGIISYFNHNYVKTGQFNSDISKIIDKTYRIREKADYQDFFIVSEADAQIQIDNATVLLDAVETYLKSINILD